ncbi:hypothetical protein CW731_02805 [Polaribacter sp. ALD11]|uniref:T9SS type A sorting domain-containing protein n=1 Tax=Polaribacter sp. ALD11 TaxID=2058137 RepID=UPI000C300F5B|nr:hypothetical protein CW731_02805 [Polaribacter sp. ALD11]
MCYKPTKFLQEEFKDTDLNVTLSVFPNPTAHNLTLQISEYNNENLSYQLFDMQGKLLSNGQVNTKKTQINTSSSFSLTYFINVLNQEKKQVQSFKIIKN